jgi:NADH dehydrogenase/NADH:ubiquinone oxidoreductase subunit G
VATIFVDTKEIQAGPGQNLLQTCLDNGIYIPNLCHIDGMEHPYAACRLCFVEIEGRKDPVASCTVSIAQGMVVKTGTPTVRALQKSALRLLLSVHDIQCKSCPANRRCELQKIARFLKVGLNAKGLEQCLKSMTIDISLPCFDLHPNRCVLCGKCIDVCRNRHGSSLLTFIRRGLDTMLKSYPAQDLRDLPCPHCTACIDICPVAAITPKQPDQPSTA